jgi:hypothetical protein
MNDHGFSKASPSGNHMIDTKPPYKQCDICGAYVDELYDTIYCGDDHKMICSDCRDKEELRADMEYERQREEG